MKRVLFACVAAAALGWGAASASVLTLGVGPAAGCYEAARADRNDNAALRECNDAWDDQSMTNQDRAATAVNRGIIRINRREVREALADFNEAIRLRPNLGEGHVNRGAALLLMDDYAGAIDAITQGLNLTPDEPHKAYFNRGLAYEAQGNLRAAYADYRRARELAPTWEPAQRELARFTVTAR